jgi:hypothetical protein
MMLRILMETQPRNMTRFAGRLGWSSDRVYRILAGNCGEATMGLTLKTLQRITEGTGIRIGQLADWWAEDENEVPIEVLEFRPNWHRPRAARRGTTMKEQRV